MLAVVPPKHATCAGEHSWSRDRCSPGCAAQPPVPPQVETLNPLQPTPSLAFIRGRARSRRGCRHLAELCQSRTDTASNDTGIFSTRTLLYHERGARATVSAALPDQGINALPRLYVTWIGAWPPTAGCCERANCQEMQPLPCAPRTCLHCSPHRYARPSVQDSSRRASSS